MKGFRLGELFCGAGGIGLGAKWASADTGLPICHEWATDISELALATYKRNLHPKRAIVADVRELDMAGLSPVDALTFGFPCNDFSALNPRRSIEGDYGALYTYCSAALRAFQPEWFMAENVSGLQTRMDGNALAIILDEFRGCGYRISQKLVNFVDYGAPQYRRRIVIVGVREDLDVNFGFPPKRGGVRKTLGEALGCPPIAVDAPNNEVGNVPDKIGRAHV